MCLSTRLEQNREIAGLCNVWVYLFFCANMIELSRRNTAGVDFRQNTGWYSMGERSRVKVGAWWQTPRACKPSIWESTEQ